VTNGAFAVAAIGSMMDLASSGQRSREGVRMGLWGAAQAIAFGLGGFAGTAASDLARYLVDSPSSAYALVFAGEATLFLVAAILAIQVNKRGAHAVTRVSSLGPLSAPGATGG
jgi:BCD family chlorophyll transporter-like MFS transporter